MTEEKKIRPQEAPHVSLISNTVLVAVLTAIGYGVGFLTQVIIAHFFGVGKALDAYVVAAIVPEIIFGVTNTLFLTSFVVLFPKYLKEHGEEKGKQLVNVLFSYGIVTLCIISILLFFLAPLLTKIIAPGFTSEQQTLVIKLLKIVVFSIPFLGLSSLFTGMLTHKHNFFSSKIVRSVISGGIITAIILSYEYVGVLSIALGSVGGIMLAVSLQYLSLKKEKYSLLITFNKNGYYLKELIMLSWPLMITSLLYYGNRVIGNMIISALSEGAVSTVNYAFLIINVPLILISVSMGTTLLPYLTKESTAENQQQLLGLFDKAAKILLYVLSLVMVIMIGLNTEIVSIILERGAFTAEATEAVGKVLTYFALGMVPWGLMNILIPLLHALKRMKEEMYLFAILIMLNSSLSFFLVKSMGESGIALATSISYSVIFCIGCVYLSRTIAYSLKGLGKEAIKCGCAAAVVAGSIFFLKNIYTGENIFFMISLSGIGVGIYLLLSVLLKSEGFIIIVNIAKKEYTRIWP